MALILRAASVAGRLEEILAGLPDEWTLLPSRWVGGRDGQLVAFVLVHPEIGIALVDLAPARPGPALGRLRDLLAGERIAGPDDTLPCVAVAIPADAIDEIGERLAEAFDAEPPCDMGDPGWAGRVTELLLDAEDAATTPLPVPQPELPPQPEPTPLDEPYGAAAAAIDADAFAPDEPMPLSVRARARDWLMAGYAAVLALLVIGGGAYILTEPADTPAPMAALDRPPLLSSAQKEATARLNPLPAELTPSAAPEPPPAPSVPPPKTAEVAQPAPLALTPAKTTPAPQRKRAAEHVRKEVSQAAPPAETPEKRVAAPEGEAKLPPAPGPVPQLRRGADGQLEVLGWHTTGEIGRTR